MSGMDSPSSEASSVESIVKTKIVCPKFWQHIEHWALICDHYICSYFTIFVAAWWKVLFEHGEVYGTTIGIIRSTGIVHVLEFYKLFAQEIKNLFKKQYKCITGYICSCTGNKCLNESMDYVYIKYGLRIYQNSVHFWWVPCLGINVPNIS